MRKLPRGIRICPTCENTFECRLDSTQKYCHKRCIRRSEIFKQNLRKLYKGKTYEERYGNNAEEIKQKHKEGAAKWIRTEEAKANMSKAHLGIPHPHTKEQDKKISESLKKLYASMIRIGENAPNWQGGISNLPYSFEFNEEFKELVRERYDYTCMLCKLTQEQAGYTLNVHHIDYDKDNLDPDNFLPLCNTCHGVTGGKNNRVYWTEVFQNVVEMNKMSVLV